MLFEPKRIESIIHYWILTEERKLQMMEREKAMNAALGAHDTYLRVPAHCTEARRKL
jgi:hypothetical protein